VASKKKYTDPVDLEIVEVQRRFVYVMENVRLETMTPQMKQHYLAVMKSITEKLEMPSKPLNEILGEMMAEAGPMIFQAMQQR
jgi:hypothetical protein